MFRAAMIGCALVMSLMDCASAAEAPGVTATEIKVGGIFPFSGPASSIGQVGKAVLAYVQSINDRGGLIWNDARGAEMPYNTHGGFLSHAYLLGINHLTETVKQLRGQAGATQVPNAHVGLATMAPAREHTTLILTS